MYSDRTTCKCIHISFLLLLQLTCTYTYLASIRVWTTICLKQNNQMIKITVHGEGTFERSSARVTVGQKK